MSREKEKEKAGRRRPPWGPFSEISRMEREMGRVFEDARGRPWFGFDWPKRIRSMEEWLLGPRIEVYEEGSDLVIQAELPGMKREDLDVDISEGTLILKGEKKRSGPEEADYHYSERFYGTFERSIEIPVEVREDEAKASFKEGVLEIRIPKTTETQRKGVKISIE